MTLGHRVSRAPPATPPSQAPLALPTLPRDLPGVSLTVRWGCGFGGAKLQRRRLRHVTSRARVPARLVAAGADLGHRAEVAPGRCLGRASPPPPHWPLRKDTGRRSGRPRRLLCLRKPRFKAVFCLGAALPADAPAGEARAALVSGGEKGLAPLGRRWGLRGWESHVPVSRPVDPATVRHSASCTSAVPHHAGCLPGSVLPGLGPVWLCCGPHSGRGQA